LDKHMICNPFLVCLGHQKFGCAIHPIVREHPVSGKPCLFVNETFTVSVVGNALCYLLSAACCLLSAVYCLPSTLLSTVTGKPCFYAIKTFGKCFTRTPR
jgi:hypothetical protein